MHHRAASQLAIAAAILCGVILSAQQGTQNPVFRSRVDAIEIEMRAIDSRGVPVSDLDRSEVEIFEDGRRQEITAFARVSIPIAPSVEAPPTNAAFTPPDVDLEPCRPGEPHLRAGARRSARRSPQYATT